MNAGMERDAAENRCPECGKPVPLCRCSLPKLSTRYRVLVLQHPREQADERGTAPLLATLLPGARVKVGLSWRNLAAAWGEPTPPESWAVLYLGSGAKSEKPLSRPVTLVSRKGAPLEEAEERSRLARLRGIVVLDGTWSQAKTLWWRNAWLLKLQRVILRPSTPSLYGKDRHEPRKECLSTLESVALWLEHAAGDGETARALRYELDRFLSDYREWSRGVTPRPWAGESEGTPP